MFSDPYETKQHGRPYVLGPRARSIRTARDVLGPLDMKDLVSCPSESLQGERFDAPLALSEPADDSLDVWAVRLRRSCRPIDHAV